MSKKSSNPDNLLPPDELASNASFDAPDGSPLSLSSSDSIDELMDLIAADVGSLLPAPPERERRLRERLMTRVEASRRAREGVRTVRGRDGEWLPFTAGIQYKLLNQSHKVRSVLVRFEAGASLPAHRHGHHEECMVLSGGLQMGELQLGPGDYHVAPSGSRHAGLKSPGGASIYLRGAAIGSGRDAVREVIGAWLPGGRELPRSVFDARDEGWTESESGVWLKSLYRPARGAGQSLLMRLAPGCTASARTGAGSDEECMMIRGEAFFGDVLLRAGEYRFAQAGVGLDRVEAGATGAVYFVHGAATH